MNTHEATVRAIIDTSELLNQISEDDAKDVTDRITNMLTEQAGDLVLKLADTLRLRREAQEKTPFGYWLRVQGLGSTNEFLIELADLGVKTYNDYRANVNDPDPFMIADMGGNTEAPLRRFENLWARYTDQVCDSGEFTTTTEYGVQIRWANGESERHEGVDGVSRQHAENFAHIHHAGQKRIVQRRSVIRGPWVDVE